jgi:hypothetical protein
MFLDGRNKHAQAFCASVSSDRIGSEGADRRISGSVIRFIPEAREQMTVAEMSTTAKSETESILCMQVFGRDCRDNARNTAGCSVEKGDPHCDLPFVTDGR